mmetsp:Transcript_35351/g.114445  ORF Transcript_35351/g.114445 Transcript_35351/m.114445 type:complete len:295 (-) Transcript_35351:2072-2956(-)
MHRYYPIVGGEVVMQWVAHGAASQPWKELGRSVCRTMAPQIPLTDKCRHEWNNVQPNRPRASRNQLVVTTRAEHRRFVPTGLTRPSLCPSEASCRRMMQRSPRHEGVHMPGRGEGVGAAAGSATYPRRASSMSPKSSLASCMANAPVPRKLSIMARNSSNRIRGGPSEEVSNRKLSNPRWTLALVLAVVSGVHGRPKSLPPNMPLPPVSPAEHEEATLACEGRAQRTGWGWDEMGDVRSQLSSTASAASVCVANSRVAAAAAAAVAVAAVVVVVADVVGRLEEGQAGVDAVSSS